MPVTTVFLLPALLFSLVVPPLLNAAPTQKKAADTSGIPTDPGWPREINKNGTRLVYYQPQIDEWKGYRHLKAQVAFSLTPKNGQAAVGVATLEGDTSADHEKRTVLITDLHIADARFPSLPEAEAKRMEDYLKQTFPGRAMTVSLDRLVAGVERSKAATKTVEVKMDPPAIFTSTEPAILLLVDGKPVEAPIENTKLQFIVNTTWNLFHDTGSSNYFLLSGQTWMTAAGLEGPWAPTAKTPADLAKLPAKDWEDVKKALPAKLVKGTTVPRVIFSDKPAELLLFDGNPVYTKIEGTKLLKAKNTESWLFQDSADKQFYFLVAGRWFRATALEGPWSYAGNDLPEDFKKIPPDSDAAEVLASVPGTEEAEDAILLAQVPTEAVVKRSEAEQKAKVAYQGEPQFQPIEGTSMTYATNTSSDLISVEGKYYLCQDAVWFVSDSPTGPWKVATNIPDAIYSIPSNSPVYRVTYVKVVESNNPDEVVCSYTAGYFGSFIAGMATGAALVWGTGWYYPPYIWWGGGGYPVYYPYYRTYGMGAVYNPWTGGYAVGGWGYGPYAGAGRAAWYNPATGRYGRVATVQGPYGGRTFASGYNPRTNTAWTTRQGNNGYAQWGRTAVRRGDNFAQAGHIATRNGGAAAYRGPNSAGAFRWNDQGRGGIVKGQDHLYAGHDGNVYRHDKGGGWDKWENGSWNSVDRNDAREKARDTAKSRSGASEAAARRQGASERRGKVENRPATHAAQNRPSTDVMNRLDHHARSRERGNLRASRAADFRGGGNRAGIGGGRGFGGGGRGFGGGGMHRGGGFRRR